MIRKEGKRKAESHEQRGRGVGAVTPISSSSSQDTPRAAELVGTAREGPW